MGVLNRGPRVRETHRPLHTSPVTPPQPGPTPPCPTPESATPVRGGGGPLSPGPRQHVSRVSLNLRPGLLKDDLQSSRSDLGGKRNIATFQERRKVKGSRVVCAWSNTELPGLCSRVEMTDLMPLFGVEDS